VNASDVVVFVGGINNAVEGEEAVFYEDGVSGGDRPAIELPPVQAGLLEALKAMGKPVVFVLCAGSAVAFNTSGLAAAIDAWYPGEAGGTAVADVLFGRYNPAGRLPITFYRRTADLPEFTNYNMAGRTYRYFSGEPLFPFGHGLSYTTFEYSSLTVPDEVKPGDEVSVSFTVKNSGARGGDEVAQVYVKTHRAEEPIKSLQWFQRTTITNGSVEQFRTTLPATAFNIFNETTGKLAVFQGRVSVCVGGSSSDRHLICKEVHLTDSNGENDDTKKMSLAVIIAVIVVAAVVVIGVIIVVIACWRKNPKREGLEKIG
jgi:beta-glucosidase